MEDGITQRCPQCDGSLFPEEEVSQAEGSAPKLKRLYQCDKNPYHLHWIEQAPPGAEAE